MDILRPPLVYIGNRCYRKNIVASVHTGGTTEFDEEDFSFAPTTIDDYADESCTIDFDDKIQKTSSGYRLTVEMPSAFLKFIIGKKGETKKRLESETRTQISIPKQNESGDIVIIGADRAGVISARTRIDIITMSARRLIPFTHFLSLPIVSAPVQTKFDKFREEVLRTCGQDHGVDRTIFQNRGKLHLTIGTLLLLSETEVNKAASFLRDCQQELATSVLRNEPMIANVQGLEYMNDDPGSVDVLYAKVSLTDGSNRLQQFADKLVDRFVGAGLMQREYDRVKLHITVMNSLMRKDPSGTTLPPSSRQNPQVTRDRESFDATNILDLLGDYKFGEQHIDSVHISQRFSTANNEYYACAAKISLP